jgi:hypothetical protein
VIAVAGKRFLRDIRASDRRLKGSHIDPLPEFFPLPLPILFVCVCIPNSPFRIKCA